MVLKRFYKTCCGFQESFGSSHAELFYKKTSLKSQENTQEKIYLGFQLCFIRTQSEERFLKFYRLAIPWSICKLLPLNMQSTSQDKKREHNKLIFTFLVKFMLSTIVIFHKNSKEAL